MALDENLGAPPSPRGVSNAMVPLMAGRSQGTPLQGHPHQPPMDAETVVLMGQAALATHNAQAGEHIAHVQGDARRSRRGLAGDHCTGKRSVGHDAGKRRGPRGERLPGRGGTGSTHGGGGGDEGSAGRGGAAQVLAGDYCTSQSATFKEELLVRRRRRNAISEGQPSYRYGKLMGTLCGFHNTQKSCS